MTKFRSGFVGLFGFPNSGKSTLINCLVGEKVSIVTAKPQTTRRRVNGILSRSDVQIIFVDTPGFVQGPKNELNEYLDSEVQNAMGDVDVAVFVLAADEIGTEKQDQIISLKRQCKGPSLLLLTKADLVSELAVPLSEEFIPVTATKNPMDTIEKIVTAVQVLLPETGAPLYDPDIYTTQSAKDMVAEVIREKCFLNLEQEVPYQLAVTVRSFKEEANMNRIECDILVAREGHKGIVIGEGASKLKKIGSQARKELEKLLDTKIYLGLHVTHKANWMKSQGIMKELGYVAQ